MPGSEFTWEQTGDHVVIRGLGTRITFDRIGDRWTHHLAFGDKSSGDHELTDLVVAVEGDTERDDPARVVSPVYQEIHRHEFAGDQLRGVCLLLTGRSFQHHFSAAASLFRDPDTLQFSVLDVDLADRCRSPVSSLAATYQVRLGSSELIEASPHAIAWSGGPIGATRLELRCDPPTTLALAEAGPHATRVQALAALESATFTHRLRYRWRWCWESNSDLTR
jgi:hypothetical protein